MRRAVDGTRLAFDRWVPVRHGYKSAQESRQFANVKTTGAAREAFRAQTRTRKHNFFICFFPGAF